MDDLLRRDVMVLHRSQGLQTLLARLAPRACADGSTVRGHIRREATVAHIRRAGLAPPRSYAIQCLQVLLELSHPLMAAPRAATPATMAWRSIARKRCKERLVLLALFPTR